MVEAATSPRAQLGAPGTPIWEGPGTPGQESKKSEHKTMISGKNPARFLTRKFSLELRIGFEVRAVEHMHQEDSRKHPGRS